jgi:uncharacterized membrane protein YsdA (DUF1294 family)
MYTDGIFVENELPQLSLLACHLVLPNSIAFYVYGADSQKNIRHETLLHQKNTLLPLILIKLGMMITFVEVWTTKERHLKF